MKQKQPSQGLKDWFKRQGLNCPATSKEAMSEFKRLSKTHKGKGDESN